MIIREALAEASAAGTSVLDASLLLASILNTSRSSLIAADARPLDEASFAAFRALIKRRLAGECVAYIVGRKEFYGLDFQVNPAVLVPRPDTETLVEAALASIEEIRECGVGSGEWGSKNECQGLENRATISDQPLRVLDLCTGSGAVAVVLKHNLPELEVWAADISAEALEVARANAARLLPPDSIHFCHGDLFDGEQHSAVSTSQSLLSTPYSPLPTPHSFHLIVSNPPYVPTAEIAGLAPEVRGEPLLALDGGSDGLGVIGRIIRGAPQFLCLGGILLLEADPRQMERIAALLQQAGFAGIQTRRDLSGAERVIVCHT
jgi:release factor glutamine methyltransferase